MSEVVKLIKSYKDRCFHFLGHPPGPGYDIIITPTKPASGSWLLDGRSLAGKAYIAKVRNGNTTATSNQDLNQIKANLQEWGLSFCTDWADVKVIRSDP